MSFYRLGYCNTDDGIELIEGNHNPDYELMEFFGTHGWYAKTKEWI